MDLPVHLTSLSNTSQQRSTLDAAILDGAVLFQMLPPGKSITLNGYIDTMFIPYMMQQVQQVNYLGVVWDVFTTSSFEGFFKGEAWYSDQAESVTLITQFKQLAGTFMLVREKPSCSIFFLDSLVALNPK